MDKIYSIVYLVTIVGFSLCIFGCLIRAIKGPKTMDRILAINMIGTMTIIIIELLSLYLKEDFLLDVDIIYALLSFLAVVVLTKVYMGVHREQEILDENARKKAEIKKQGEETEAKK